MQIENTILSNLIFNDEYMRKILPFIKEEYFRNPEDLIAFQLIRSFIDKYNALPTKEALIIELSDKENIPEMVFKTAKELINSLSYDKVDIQWLIDSTEKFCQERAIHNALLESIKILDGKAGQKDKGSIPNILSDALAVSFDNRIGHDFLEDFESRYEYYTRKEEKLSFHIDYLNIVTNGGIPRKTLNVLMAGTGAGKTLVMCDLAANYLTQGQKVLYITLEMAEEEISKRIDANLLNVPVSEIQSLSKDSYAKKVKKVKETTTGKLIVREYPTAQAGSGHFRYLLNELRLKKGFVPDVIFIDYLNICCSSRIKSGSNASSYTLIKSIAEELRGLAIEFNTRIWTATQTNREGSKQNDNMDMTDVSESFGLPMTVDFFLGLRVSEELDRLGQMMMVVLKNRYQDPSLYKRRFTVGLERRLQRLLNISQDEAPESENKEDSSIFDNSSFGDRLKDEDKKGKFSKILI